MPRDGRTAKKVLIILFLITLIADQFTKFLVQQQFLLGESRPSLLPWMDWTYTLNAGVAFGMLRDHPIWVTSMAAFFVVILTVMWIRWMRDPKSSIWVLVSMTLILAGAVGNLADRIRVGRVIDFIDWRVWPVFNIADSAITVGAVIMVVSTFLLQRSHPKTRIYRERL